jgi:hypothetical protein
LLIRDSQIINTWITVTNISKIPQEKTDILGGKWSNSERIKKMSKEILQLEVQYIVTRFFNGISCRLSRTGGGIIKHEIN